MAGIRGALMSLLLVFGTAYGQSAQETPPTGTSTPPAVSPEGRGSSKITLRMYNYGVARSTLVQAERKALKLTISLDSQGIRQNGTSKSVPASTASSKGLSASSAGSAAFEDSAAFAPFPFLAGPNNRSSVTTTSVTSRFFPSRSS